MEDTDYLNLLIASAESAYLKLKNQHLVPGGFALESEKADDRFILGPHRNYTVMHRMFCWRSAAGGRFVWFQLDCEVPHVSSIVACMGFPPPGSSLPTFVMNLNLKLRFSNYNTIIGFRGAEASLLELEASVPRLPSQGPQPSLTKPPPPGFAGVRAMFALGEQPVHWSVATAEAALTGWFARVNDPGRALASDAASSTEAESYRQEMLELHAREGQGFDGIFGESWLYRLFSHHVFPSD